MRERSIKTPFQLARGWRRYPLSMAIALWAATFVGAIGLLLAALALTLSYRVYEAAGENWLHQRHATRRTTSRDFKETPLARATQPASDATATGAGAVDDAPRNSWPHRATR
jgi:hypothetical protein